ncbi:hypothetical protein JTB14_016374 [Gonioctena quinquepunctata]|nr:hypothetical protein JTB14_016374 [Gonioctena quinquepunctata]
MAEHNNAIDSIENNLQMISIIDNELNYTEYFEGGYVEDMIVEGELFPITNDDEVVLEDLTIEVDAETAANLQDPDYAGRYLQAIRRELQNSDSMSEQGNQSKGEGHYNQLIDK